MVEECRKRPVGPEGFFDRNIVHDRLLRRHVSVMPMVRVGRTRVNPVCTFAPIQLRPKTQGVGFLELLNDQSIPFHCSIEVIFAVEYPDQGEITGRGIAVRNIKHSPEQNGGSTPVAQWRWRHRRIDTIQNSGSGIRDNALKTIVKGCQRSIMFRIRLRHGRRTISTHAVAIDVDIRRIYIPILNQPLINPMVPSLCIIYHCIVGQTIIVGVKRIPSGAPSKVRRNMFRRRWIRAAVAKKIVVVRDQDAFVGENAYNGPRTGNRLMGCTATAMQPNGFGNRDRGIQTRGRAHQKHAGHPIFVVVGHYGKIRSAFPLILPTIRPHIIGMAGISRRKRRGKRTLVVTLHGVADRIVLECDRRGRAVDAGHSCRIAPFHNGKIQLPLLMRRKDKHAFIAQQLIGTARVIGNAVGGIGRDLFPTCEWEPFLLKQPARERGSVRARKRAWTGIDGVSLRCRRDIFPYDPHLTFGVPAAHICLSHAREA